MQSGIFPPLNTKEDYYLAIQTNSSNYKQLFQDLLDTRVMWVKERELSSPTEGITDSTHKVIVVPQVGGVSKVYQYALQENTEAKIFKLGFTVTEVMAIVASAQ